MSTLLFGLLLSNIVSNWWLVYCTNSIERHYHYSIKSYYWGTSIVTPSNATLRKTARASYSIEGHLGFLSLYREFLASSLYRCIGAGESTHKSLTINSNTTYWGENPLQGFARKHRLNSIVKSQHFTFSSHYLELIPFKL